MLKGMVTLVTGGASGLGQATVQRVVREGGKAVICDLPTSQGHTLQEEIGAEHAVFVPTDVTSESDVQQALDVCKEKFGGLNVVVNCAGLGRAMITYNAKKKKSHSYEYFMDTLRINLGGTFNVTRLGVALIDENQADENGQKGVVINTSSIAAFDGQVGQVAYTASKAGIAGMTLPLARDLASCGIRVCCIAPGLFLTPLLLGLPKKVQETLATTVPCPRRFGDPDEFAMMVQSIITNPMLNGEVIRLDGALRMMA